MEIYKLNDDVLEEKFARNLTKRQKHDAIRNSASLDASVSGEVLKITDLRQGGKNPNRVNVFVNGRYSFSLDISQVVELGVKVGREVSASELVDYKKASEYGKLYQRTLEWVLMRPRSVRETRDYLNKKLRNVLRGPLRDDGSERSEVSPTTTGGYERVREEYSEFFDEIIQTLITKGYVDDRKFAEYYVENRFVKKGISRKRLKMELMKKGISRDIIEDVLDVRNDEEEIRKIIVKKRPKYDDEKLMAYLVRQGFSYDLVRRMMQDD